MKGCLLPDGTLPVVFALRKEIVMQTTDRTAAAIDVDVHRRFSTVTVRNLCEPRGRAVCWWTSGQRHCGRTCVRSRRSELIAVN